MRAAAMLQRCGILRPPPAARATTSASASGRHAPPPSQQQLSSSCSSRRPRARVFSPITAVMTPPPSRRESPSSSGGTRRRASSSSSSAAAAAAAAASATTTTTLDDDALSSFDHLELNDYDVRGILLHHAQRQSFPSAAADDPFNSTSTMTSSSTSTGTTGTNSNTRDGDGGGAFSTTTSLEDEFPPAPPTMSYEEVAPYVELVRLEQAPSTPKKFDKHEDKQRRGGERRPNEQGLALPVLVGWFGCRRSHLRKYAAMYLSPELGYDAVVCIRPPAAATLFPALGDAFAASALSAMETIQRRFAAEDKAAAAAAAAAAEEEAEKEAAAADGAGAYDDDDDETGAAVAGGEESSSSAQRPVLLHLFSNGGYLFAGNVMHAHMGRDAGVRATTTSTATNALLRTASLAPDPSASERFTSNVAALVMDSAPGELEPGMVASSFQAVLQGKAAPAPATDDAGGEGGGGDAVGGGGSDSDGGDGGGGDALVSATLRQTAAALLLWAPIARRMRFVDAAWGGFPAVSGRRAAAEVAFASAANAEAAMNGKGGVNWDGSLTAAMIARRLREEETPGGLGLLWCPALFVYSRADPLIPSSHVEAFASHRAARLGRVASAKTRGRGVGGGLVVMKRWDSAPHCEIGRMDPVGYVAALKDFLIKPGSSAAAAAGGSGGGAASATNSDVKPWDRDQ